MLLNYFISIEISRLFEIMPLFELKFFSEHCHLYRKTNKLRLLKSTPSKTTWFISRSEPHDMLPPLKKRSHSIFALYNIQRHDWPIYMQMLRLLNYIWGHFYLKRKHLHHIEFLRKLALSQICIIHIFDMNWSVVPVVLQNIKYLTFVCPCGCTFVTLQIDLFITHTHFIVAH